MCIRDSPNVAPSPSIPALPPESVCTLTMDQMRSIMSIIFSGHKHASPNSDLPATPVVDLSNSTPNPTPFFPLSPNVECESTTDDNAANNRVESKFKLEIALGRLQSYYSISKKFSGDFEDDLDDSLAEFNTACRGQMAPDEVKPEMFRLAIKGRALTCLLYTSPSPRDLSTSRMPSSA